MRENRRPPDSNGSSLEDLLREMEENAVEEEVERTHPLLRRSSPIIANYTPPAVKRPYYRKG